MIREVIAYEAFCDGGCGATLQCGRIQERVIVYLAINGWYIGGGKVICDACRNKTATKKGKRR